MHFILDCYLRLLPATLNKCLLTVKLNCLYVDIPCQTFFATKICNTQLINIMLSRQSTLYINTLATFNCLIAHSISLCLCPSTVVSFCAKVRLSIWPAGGNRRCFILVGNRKSGLDSLTLHLKVSC